MKKVAIIIPGFGYSGKEKEYKKIAGFFKGKGIETVVCDISWKRRSFSQYLEQFNEAYGKHLNDRNEIYLLGFSFGAMMATVVASENKIKKLFLCSLSPFFKEDLSSSRSWWLSYHGKRRIADFEKLSFARLAKTISCKTFILAGDKEGIEVERRAKDATKKLRNSKLIFIEGAKHDISNEKYLEKIVEIV